MSTCAININGEIYDEHNAKISVFDRGFLYGDSIYEVFRVYQGVIFKLDEHLQRLFLSAKKIGMSLPYEKEYLIDMAYATVSQLSDQNCYLRMTVTRGVGPIGLDADLSMSPNLIIIAKTQGAPAPSLYNDGVKLVITEILKTDKDSIDPNLKSGNYLNNIMAYMEAKKLGAYDAIMLNRDGMISEATTANVWMVNQQGQFITPPVSAGILEGITKKSIIEIASKHGFVVLEKQISPHELLSAQECFLSSSFKELVPVVMINNQKIGSGKPSEMYQKIHHAYRQSVEEYVHLHPAKKLLHD